MSKLAWDYETVGTTCQWPVGVEYDDSYGLTEGPREATCEEPAPYRVWWCDEEGNEIDSMWLCAAHFAEVEAAEREASDEVAGE